MKFTKLPGLCFYFKLQNYGFSRNNVLSEFDERANLCLEKVAILNLDDLRTKSIYSPFESGCLVNTFA